MLMNVNKNGFWEGMQAEKNHKYDLKLSTHLTDFFKQENVTSLADFGCGMGKYVNHFNDNGINACGFDGNPNTPELTNCTCSVMDLTIPKKFNKPFDWVMSLEVGEHLPKDAEDTFINNLHDNNKHGIVLSWAIKGQGGDGHINEQNNDYIKSRICELGYTNDIDAENKFRKNCTLYWFRNTIMVFRKNVI